MSAGHQNGPDQAPKISDQEQDGARRRELSPIMEVSHNGTNLIVKSSNLVESSNNTVSTKHVTVLLFYPLQLQCYSLLLVFCPVHRLLVGYLYSLIVGIVISC